MSRLNSPNLHRPKKRLRQRSWPARCVMFQPHDRMNFDRAGSLDIPADRGALGAPVRTARPRKWAKERAACSFAPSSFVNGFNRTSMRSGKKSTVSKGPLLRRTSRPLRRLRLLPHQIPPNPSNRASSGTVIFALFPFLVVVCLWVHYVACTLVISIIIFHAVLQTLSGALCSTRSLSALVRQTCNVNYNLKSNNHTRHYSAYKRA
jgi:hypothetical protein